MELTVIVPLFSEQLVRIPLAKEVWLMAVQAFSAPEWEHDDGVHGFAGALEEQELPVE